MDTARILSTPSLKVLSVLKTAASDCMVFCISSLKSAVGTAPFEYRKLSNLSKILSTEFEEIVGLADSRSTTEPALMPAARPKTTRSMSEFEPNRFAPCTDAHPASPTAIRPGTVLF